jgi:hypothetical protein
MSIVIVALPEEDDPVHKYSSEKVPHMTLLYLGDNELQDQENTLQYIQHVAKTSLTKFGMSVSRRGPLGPNDADVLFFANDWDNKDLVALRSFLLANDNIKIAHDSAEQFEGWTPHLTMGFPETPAKPDDRDYPGFHYVRFDRIAVWFDDYDGPEFLLESNEMSAFPDSSGTAWSDENPEEEVVEHADKRTVQDVLDDMLPDEREVFDLIVGAAVDDIDLSDDDEAVVGYDLMSDEEKGILAFVVGSVTSEDYDTGESLKQYDLEDTVGDILEHSGVKGMKWGVRTDKKTGEEKSSSLSKSDANTHENRKAARAAVKVGNATLGDAHKAALKSKGHRVANAFLGDKKAWKQLGLIALATAAGVGLAFAIPALIPASVFGATVIGGTTIAGGAAAASAQASLTANLVGGALATGYVASYVSSAGNVVRAIAGNHRVNKSYEALGTRVNDISTSGNKKVQKTLKDNGGIKKKFLTDSKATAKHSALEELVGEILGPKVLEQSDFDNLVDDILEHSGVKGMRWGYRRKTNSDGLVVGKVPKNPADGGPGGSTAAPAGSADHDRAITALAKKNEHGVEALSNQDLKDINTRMKALDEFQKAMTPAQKSDLQKQVEELKLHKELRQLQAEDRLAHQSAGKKLVKSLLMNGSELVVNNVAKELGISGGHIADKILGNTEKERLKEAEKRARERTDKEREERRQDIRAEIRDRRKEAREDMRNESTYQRDERRRREREAEADQKQRQKDAENERKESEKQRKKRQDGAIKLDLGSDGVYR